MNSITDNPVQGDERNFVQARLMTAGSQFSEEATACAGQIVEIYSFFENDAADNLASTTATIHGLTEEVLTGGQGGNRIDLGVVLSAKNATAVWDGARIVCSNSAIHATYISGTARLFTLFTPTGGSSLPDSGFEPGGKGLIGAKGPDGELPVGREGGKYLGAGYFSFQVQVT